MYIPIYVSGSKSLVTQHGNQLRPALSGKFGTNSHPL